MQRVLVQELKCPGHCVPFAINVANTLATSGDEILLVLNGIVRDRLDSEGSVWKRHESVRIEFIDSIDLEYNCRATAQMEVSVCEQFIETFDPQRVVLPTGDGVVKWVMRDRPRRAKVASGTPPWEVVVHSIPASVPAMGLRSFGRWLTSRCSLERIAGARLLSPDPYSTIGPGRRWLGRRTRASIGFLPLPVPTSGGVDRGEARRRMGLPESGRLLVVPGVIDPRKAIARLLGARPSLEGVVDGVVFAGPVAVRVEPLIEAARNQPGPEIHVLPRYLDEPEFVDVILAADVIWAVYPHWRGVASIQLLAGALGRSCLVDASHDSSVWAASHGRGAVIVRDSVKDAVREALRIDEPSSEYRSFVDQLTSSRVQRAVLCEGAWIDSIEALERHDAES